MNKYEELADKLAERLVKNKGTVELTHEETMKIINYLFGMSRIQKITESEKGGAELFY